MKFENTKEEKYVDMGYTKEDELATEDIEMHFIEIPKFIKKNCGINTKLEQWLWLLTGKGEKVEMAEKENKEIKKAIEILEEMSMDEKEWELYQSRKMAEIDYNSKIALAREEGEKRKSKEIAKKLIETGMDLKQVGKITGLSEKEIKKIQYQK